MDDRTRSSEAQVHAANLDYTLKELQRKVREYEAELNELRSAHQHHQAPQSASGQARVIKAALEHATNSEPFLPFPGSVLPALLALRKTHQAIQESKAFLASQAETKEGDRRQLEAERVALRDHKLLGEALGARIQSLRAELDSRAEMGAREGTLERMEELEDKRQGYGRETKRLMKVLNRFIDDHLAAMLAAEELGGPVVGDMMDIDSEDLAAGFNAQGKPKQVKGSKDKAKVNEDKRQRRIDEIWGSGSGSGSNDQGQQQQQQQQHHHHHQQTDEVASAGAEMRQLTEELLNRLIEAKGSNAESYVRLGRESAALRFLIRSKVAQFHPKDATRIRLVDFGRELD